MSRVLIHVVSYLRSVLGLLFTVPFTLFMSVVTIAIALFGWDRGIDQSIGFWARVTMRLFNVRIELQGLENLQRDRGVLFLFNHQSNFDILCIHGHVPKRVRFGAKIELFKIPFFGAAMRMSGTLPIVRENRSEVFRVYREAQEKFAANWSFSLAPEGTRQSEARIGSFKKGPFIFAVNAQAPVQPIVIEGAYDVLPKSDLLPNKDQWRRVIRMRFLPVIETAGKSVPDIADIADRAHKMTVAAFDEMRRERGLPPALSVTVAPRSKGPRAGIPTSG